MSEHRMAPRRQLRWWRPGGFRWPWLARLTRGRLGLGRWTEAEIARHRAEAQTLARLLDKYATDPHAHRAHDRHEPEGDLL